MRALFVVDESSRERTAPLREWLAHIEGLEVELTSDVHCVCRLARADVVVALVDAAPLPGPAEAQLAAHLAQGGGMVLLGATLWAWRDAVTVTGLLGKPGERQPVAEIIVQAAPQPALRRTDGSFPVKDCAWLDGGVPGDAAVWLRTSWHFRDQVLGWSCGRSVAITLGSTAATCADERFARLLLRAVRHAAALDEAPAVRVGMLGYGAIGAEHAQAIADVQGLELAAVCDRDPARVAAASAAHPQIRRLTDAAELASAEDVDLVLVSVPPNRHAETARSLLAAGKHVVVEKPFALSAAEADALIAQAEASERCLTVYQNRRWDPDFRAVRACTSSGRIGELFHIETFVGGYAHPCRYWHSHEPVSGGVVYDWGSHYLDWILQLLPAPIAAVSGARHKRVWHDVTNADMARVSVRFAGGEEAVFVHSDIAAASKPKWYVLGTRGAVTAQWREERLLTRGVSEEILESPLMRTDVQAAVHLHTVDGAGRTHVESVALPQRLAAPFHRNLADHLLTGEPLAVTPAEARRVTAVLEAASASALRGGEPVRFDEERWTGERAARTR